MDTLAAALEAVAQPPNNDALRQGEATLDAAKQSPGFSVVLLQLVLSDSVSAPARVLAAILFKQTVDSHWNPGTDNEYEIPQQDKAILKQNGVQALLRCDPGVALQIEEAIKIIISCDWPQQWPELVPLLIEVIKSENDPRALEGSLKCFLSIVKNYEYTGDGKKRQPLDMLVQETFPFMFDFLCHICQQNTPESAQLVKLILKVFYSAFHLKMPSFIRNQAVMGKWIEKMLEIFMMPLPPGEPADPIKRREWPPWKAKKWCLHVFCRAFSRYGDPTLAKSKKNKQWARAFSKGMATVILQRVLQVLDSFRNGVFITDRIQTGILRYLTTAVRHSSTWAIIVPYYETLLTGILFPLVCFSSEDAVIYEEDPTEFVRREYDIIEEYYNVKSAATALVNTLVMVRPKEAFPALMKLISMDFQNQQKEGTLTLMGAVANEIKGHEEYSEHINEIICKYILPEMGSSQPYLVARATWALSRFIDEDTEEEEIVVESLKRTLHLLEHPDLVVRTQAALAMRFLVQNEHCQPKLLPILPQVFETYFKLMSEIDNDDLVSSLETIIYVFREQIGPYAVQICQHLTSQIGRLLASTADGEIDDPEVEASALAASECARTLVTVLMGIRRDPKLYNDVTVVLLPFLRESFALTDNFDMLETNLKILSFITYFIPKIPIEIWAFFPVLINASNGYALDYMQEMVPYFDNIISRDPETFLTAGENGVLYVQMMWQMCEEFFKEQGNEAEVAEILKLIEVILQNCRGRVDILLPEIIVNLTKRLYVVEDPNLKTLLFAVYGNCFYYNPVLTLQVMEAKDFTTVVLENWLKDLHEGKLIKRVYDQKQCVLGLTALLEIPASEMPESVQKLLKPIVELLVITLNRMNDQISQAKEKREQKKAEREVAMLFKSVLIDFLLALLQLVSSLWVYWCRFFED